MGENFPRHRQESDFPVILAFLPASLALFQVLQNCTSSPRHLKDPCEPLSARTTAVFQQLSWDMLQIPAALLSFILLSAVATSASEMSLQSISGSGSVTLASFSSSMEGGTGW